MKGRAFSLDMAGVGKLLILGTLMALLSSGGSFGREIAGSEHRPVLAEDGRYHGLGLMDTGIDSLDPSHMAPPIEVSGPLPAAVDNSAGLPPMGDQGAQGSCGAWSIGYYCKSYAEGKEHGWSVSTPDHQFSPAFIYNQARIPPDRGMWFNDTMLLVERLGCPTLATQPYDQADCTSWPPEAAYREALQYRTKNHYWIKTSSGQGALSQMKAHIAGGGIGLLAIDIYKNFQNISSYGYNYCLADKTGNYSGGHAVTAIGYDDNRSTADGMGAFRCVNQWGAEWGEAGFFWISYQAVMDSSNRICQGWYGYIEENEPDTPSYAAKFNLSYDRFRALEIVLSSAAGQSNLFEYMSYQNSQDLAVSAPPSAIWVDLSPQLPLGEGEPVTLQIKNLDPANGLSGQIASFELFRFSDGATSSSPQIPAAIPSDGSAIEVSAPFAFAGIALSCTASGDPISGPAPLAVNFAGSASGGTPPYGYAWDFGDGDSSTEEEPSHTFNISGTYQVKLTVKDAVGAEAVSGVQIDVTEACAVTCEATFPTEVAPFVAVDYSCTYQAANCSGLPSFLWDFGDGTTSNAQSESFSYQAIGTYNWSLTVTVDGVTCRRSGTVVVSTPCAIITIGQPPQDQTIQAGQRATLSVSATCETPLSYEWFEGKSMDFTHPIDGANEAIYQTPPLYESKQYWVSVGNGCRAIFPKEATVTVIPAVCALESCSASANPASGMSPLSVSFDAAAESSGCTGAPQFEWEFGDGSAGVGRDAIHIYSSPGIYNWTMTATVDDQSCVKSGTVKVSGIPGDCDGDGSVSIGEVQKAINMFLGALAPDCGVDCNGDGQVSIGELQKVINAFLGFASQCS